MAGILTQALSYTSLAVVAALVGGVIAVYRAPGPQMESNVQHLAAGVVFAAVAAELLPDIHNKSPEVVVAGFAAGVVAMLGIHRLIGSCAEFQAQKLDTVDFYLIHNV